MRAFRRLAKGLRRCALAAAASAAVVAPALAEQSLKSIRAQEAEEEELSGEAAYTNSVCDADIDARIDWSSTRNWPDGESLVAACNGALGALEAVCRRGGSAKRINTFVCAGDGSGPSLKGGVFRYGARPGDNGFESARAYLESAL